MVKARRKKAVKQLRRFLQIPDDEEIDERDVPIVCLGGSGGGFRAVSKVSRLAECAVSWADLTCDATGMSVDAGLLGDDGGRQGGWHVGLDNVHWRSQWELLGARM